MQQQSPTHFWHSPCRQNNALIESYCLECNRFVAASGSEANLALMEMAHRISCKLPGERKKQ